MARNSGVDVFDSDVFNMELTWSVIKDTFLSLYTLSEVLIFLPHFSFGFLSTAYTNTTLSLNEANSTTPLTALLVETMTSVAQNLLEDIRLSYLFLENHANFSGLKVLVNSLFVNVGETTATLLTLVLPVNLTTSLVNVNLFSTNNLLSSQSVEIHTLSKT